ncbi:MAG: efflux RND transporter permease subunit [Acidobacteriota bacterium]
MLRAIIERPVSVGIATLTLVILGFFSLLRLPVSLLPTLERPRLVVTAIDADRSRADLIHQVAEPLERRFLSLPGVLAIHSAIDDGECRLSVETEWQTDVDRLRIDAERRLAEVSGLGLDELVVRVDAGDALPILQIAVTGGRSAAERTTFADKVLAPELGRLSGAGRLTRLGGASRRAVVQPRAAALAARDLTASDLVDRLHAVGRSQPTGRMRDGGRVRPLVMREPVGSIAELGTRRVGSEPGVPLSELANLHLAEVADASLVRIDGDSAVLVELHRAPGANAVLLARAARRAVAELGSRAAAGPVALQLTVVRDASLEVVDALTQLALAAFLGLLLGTFVLRWMLGSWRPTLALAIVVPASILIAFGGFYLWGVSLDIVSLAGLALAAGMLVDNSIVVLEAIAAARGRRDEASEEDPVITGTRHISLALVASFLTTAVVFLPLIYLQGLARAFFGVQAFAIVTSLAVSLVLSLSLTPTLARRASTENAPGSGRRPGLGLYRRTLEPALRQPWAVVAMALLLLAAVASQVPSLPTELVPPGPAQALTAEVRLPSGLDHAATRERLASLESTVPDGVASTLAILRRHDPLRPESTEDKERGELEVRLAAANDLEPVQAEMAQRLARRAGLDVTLHTRRSAVAQAMERSARGLEVEASATSQRRTAQLAERLRAAITAALPDVQVRRATSEFGSSAGGSRASADRSPRPAFVLGWDNWRLAQLGAEPSDLTRQLRSALGGFYAGRIDIEGVEPEILVEATRPNELRLLPVRPPTPASGGSTNGVQANGAEPTGPRVLPLAALASIEQRLQEPPLERRDGRPAIRLEIAGPGSAGLTPQRLEAILAEVPLAVDERVRQVGQVEELRRSFGQLRLALGLGLVLVFLTVAALYESLTLPLVVMSTVPVAAAGALAALLASGQSLNVMSFLGIILLTGIVVNNAIVLVHRIEQRRTAGQAPVDAVREAASERYRPILMTTLTTLLGMVPLAALGGQGVELRGALATAVSGGLVTALFATLLLVPALHLVLVRRQH